MPRSKPSDVREVRHSLSTWERDRIENLGVMVGGGALAAGVGVLLLPLSIVGAAGLAGLLFSKDIEEALDKVKDLADRMTHPNRLGGTDAVIEITKELTSVEDGIAAPYSQYQSTSAWRKNQRVEAFNQFHNSPNASEDPQLSKEWAQWIHDNKLPLMLGLKTGGLPGAIPEVAGVVYQTSIRVTAARRKRMAWGGMIPVLGAPAVLATLFGSAMPGEYYTNARDAPGFIADPLLDWVAVESFQDEPWGAFATLSHGTGQTLVDASEALDPTEPVNPRIAAQEMNEEEGSG
jgi:hypothetical protein